MKKALRLAMNSRLRASLYISSVKWPKHGFFGNGYYCWMVTGAAVGEVVGASIGAAEEDATINSGGDTTIF